MIFPIATLLGTTRWIRSALAEIRAARRPIPIMDQLPRFAGFLDFIGLPEIHELEDRTADMSPKCRASPKAGARPREVNSQ